MKVLYVFLIIYILIFILDNCILKNIKKCVISEYDYMKYRFKLKNSSKFNKKSKLISSLLNAFIIAFVSTLCLLLKWPLFILLPVAFILLILLIYSIYGIYGNILWRKQNEKTKKVKK